MKINVLRRIHIVSPVLCVWPVCTAVAGNCVNITTRIIREQTFYVHKKRLAVMYRLAVHNIMSVNRNIQAHAAASTFVKLINYYMSTAYEQT